MHTSIQQLHFVQQTDWNEVHPNLQLLCFLPYLFREPSPVAVQNRAPGIASSPDRVLTGGRCPRSGLKYCVVDRAVVHLLAEGSVGSSLMPPDRSD
jgi:hypothetical protein